MADPISGDIRLVTMIGAKQVALEQLQEENRQLRAENADLAEKLRAATMPDATPAGPIPKRRPRP